MFQMLNLAYISHSSDFDIFLLNITFFFFLTLLNYVVKLTYTLYCPKLSR